MAGGECDHGVEIEFRDLGKFLREERKAEEQIDERRLVGRRGAAEAGDELSCLP